jgi:hypothetical protein
LKIGFNPMCMLTLLKTKNFTNTKLYNKLKIENCEDIIEFYNKLKPLTYLYSSAYLWLFKKVQYSYIKEFNLFSRVYFQFFGSNSALVFNSNKVSIHGLVHGLVFLPVHQNGVGLGLFRSQELEPLCNHKKLSCFPPFIFFIIPLR